MVKIFAIAELFILLVCAVVIWSQARYIDEQDQVLRQVYLSGRCCSCDVDYSTLEECFDRLEQCVEIIKIRDDWFRQAVTHRLRK